MQPIASLGSFDEWIVDFENSDTGYVPVVAAHYLENTGDMDLVYLGKATLVSTLELDDTRLTMLQRSSNRLPITTSLSLNGSA